MKLCVSLLGLFIVLQVLEILDNIFLAFPFICFLKWCFTISIFTNDLSVNNFKLVAKYHSP